MTKDDGGGANGEDSNSSGSSKSTQRIISVTQPESARNKNKAHGYSVGGPTNDPALKKSEQVHPFFHLAILSLRYLFYSSCSSQDSSSVVLGSLDLIFGQGSDLLNLFDYHRS